MPQWIVWKRRWKNIQGEYNFFWDGHLIFNEHRCVTHLYFLFFIELLYKRR
jgi:hypothetical protein